MTETTDQAPDNLEETDVQRLQRMLGAATAELDRLSDGAWATADAIQYFPHGDPKRETHVMVPIPEINKLLRAVYKK